MMGLFFIGLVSAITVGTIYTQTQLDSADVRLSMLNPSWETKANGNLYINQSECRTDADVCYAYVTLATTLQKNQEYDNETSEPIGDVYYEVIEKTVKIPFRTTKYYDIKAINGTQVAYDTLMADLFPRAKQKIQDEIRRINNWKTRDIITKQESILDIVDGKSVDGIVE